MFKFENQKCISSRRMSQRKKSDSYLPERSRHRQSSKQLSRWTYIFQPLKYTFHWKSDLFHKGAWFKYMNDKETSPTMLNPKRVHFKDSNTFSLRKASISRDGMILISKSMHDSKHLAPIPGPQRVHFNYLKTHFIEKVIYFAHACDTNLGIHVREQASLNIHVSLHVHFTSWKYTFHWESTPLLGRDWYKSPSMTAAIAKQLRVFKIICNEITTALPKYCVSAWGACTFQSLTATEAVQHMEK